MSGSGAMTRASAARRISPPERFAGSLVAGEAERLQQVAGAVVVVALGHAGLDEGQRGGEAGEIGRLRQIAHGRRRLQETRAAIGLDLAGGDLQERRLARAVAADQAQMPKRTDIDSILIIGAGPIVIGQACEFDYSGTQACKALKEEGYRIVLVNSNPATIMTDPGPGRRHLYRADHARDRRQDHREGASGPDASLLPTMGGQTALNCALSLARWACSRNSASR
jgi:hypothetical protein